MAKSKTGKTALVPVEIIERKIHVVRDQKIMLDSDLAELYGVSTGRLNEQVTRNRSRFPEDFAFRLSREEVEDLKSQNAISSSSHGGRRKPPRAFTEHGILMLSSVLRSERAVQMNIAIMRAFVRLRELLLTHDELRRGFRELEAHEEDIGTIFEALRQLLTDEKSGGRAIGFE